MAYCGNIKGLYGITTHLIISKLHIMRTNKNLPGRQRPDTTACAIGRQRNRNLINLIFIGR